MPSWLVPVVFVCLWSSGYIGTRVGLPYAEPFPFIALRFLVAGTALGVVAVATRRSLRFTRAQWVRLSITGLLVQGGFLGFMFTAMAGGLPPALAALVGSFQPLVTAALARVFLGAAVTKRMWIGLTLGLVGVFIVLADRLSASLGAGGPLEVVFASLAVLSIAAGTLYQSRALAGVDLVAGTAVQYVAPFCGAVLVAGLLGETRVSFALPFVAAVTWLALGLSVGAVLLLYRMLRDHEPAVVSSLFYLVPGVTAIVAWVAFGDRLSVRAVLGLGLSAAGVALATARRPLR